MKGAFLIIFGLLTVAALAQKNDPELLQADRAFASLSYKTGVANAFDRFLAEDAVFLSSTPLPMEGKASFMKLFANSKSSVIWQPTGAFRDQSGTSGYTYGLSKWIYPIGDSLGNAYYVYNTNWIKDAANEWKVTTDIGTEISLKRFELVSKEKFKRTFIAKPVVMRTSKEKNCRITYFNFASDRKGVVPALLVVPNSKPVKGVVCYQHGMGPLYHKEYFLLEAKQLAEKGFASLMLDAPFQRKGESYIESGGMKDAEIFENNCVEWLQAVDQLPALGIRTNNFVFVGQSYGARVAAFMPYLDQRFKKVMIISGIYNYAEWMQTTVVDQIAKLRKQIPPAGLAAYVQSVGPYDASLYLHKKNDIAFYFQAGTMDDTLSEYDILSCYEMTNSKKTLKWYPTGHDLNYQAITDRVEQVVSWFE